MNPGDKVKIKPYKTILYNKTNDSRTPNKFYANGLLFDPAMKSYCETEVTIDRRKVKSYGTIYNVRENKWWWHEKWLTSDFFSEEDFEI